MSPRILVAFVLALLSFAAPAQGRSRGLAALGCEGCHDGGQEAKVTMIADPMSAAVGEPVILTITVSQTNGASAGFYLTTAFDSPGEFRAIESGTAVDTSGVLHTTPRSGAGGSTTFKAQWTATQPTGVAFDAYALSANGDRTNRGDGAGAAHLQLAIGCAGRTFYIDQDGDGFGSTDPAYPSRQACEQPLGYAAELGDCDDFRALVHPGASEQCDLRDNDCNGEVDDNVVSQIFCEDRDGDGHGATGRSTITDCKPAIGFGVCDGDCDDGDERFHPGAPEVCDLRDNDCDGKTDEGVRPICGVGLCAREALTCDAADCTPGDPFPETCNGYDDDCDGTIDDPEVAALCDEAGSRCLAGKCVVGAGGGSGAGTGGAPGGGANGSGSSPADGARSGGATPPGSCTISPRRRAGGCSFGCGALLALLLLRRTQLAPQFAARERRRIGPGPTEPGRRTRTRWGGRAGPSRRGRLALPGR